MSCNASGQFIEALQQPDAYNHPAEDIQLLETHLSWVLLAGLYAYKIKKPVEFSFADFSTLEKRKFYCQQELRLNGRLAPELYLDVIPITGTPNAPHVGGDGEPIEYAVRMKRFPQDALLSHAVEQGTLLTEHIDYLVQEVSEFHRLIGTAADDSPFGTPERILEPVEENFLQINMFLDDESQRESEFDIVSLRNRIESLQAWSEHEFAARKENFLSRKRNGFVRECHGDMHLGNMVLHDGAVTLFDCVEFNESFRWVDIISEAAFLVMDLEDRGRPDFAHRFLNGYLEQTEDYSGLAVFPFYLTYRALVRAKVACLRMGQEGLSQYEHKQLHEEFLSYLELAEQYTQSSEPLLMITHGYSGSGKTFGTQPVVEELGAVRVRSDVERKRLFGLSPLEKNGSQAKEKLYSSDAGLQTYHRLQELAKAIIQSGFSVIVDATFLKRKDRDQFRQLAKQLSVPFIILDLPASVETLKQRVAQRAETGLDASEAGLAVLERQLQYGEPLSNDERSLAIVIDTEKKASSTRLITEIEKKRA
jgi:aminoglycoside phosphotransferase family enzyme/predicted kinase